MSSPSPSSSGDPIPPQSSREAARSIAADIAHRWDSGETITEDEAVAANPQIAEELLEELRSARSIRRAFHSARRAGQIPEPISILSPAELEASIDISDDPPGAEAPREAPSLPGYTILELIREGGQATVYKGIQESTERVVAIKVMNDGSAALSRHRARFDREVHILSRLNHRNIVSIIDTGRATCGSFCLVMEFVAGPELDDYCQDYLPKDEAGTTQLLRLFAKIAQAIEVAHRNGVVHRDLKPSNIRIDEHGEPRLLDFGLASVTRGDVQSSRDLTLSGQILGSVPWTSPEQVGGSGDIGPLSDVYALGVVLYQMLAGEFPYAINGPLHEALANIANAQPAPPSRVSGARPVANRALVDAIVLKALNKDPAARHSSAGAFARDLECVWEGGEASVTPRRSQKLQYWLAVVLFFSLVGVVLGLSMRPSPPAVEDLPKFVNTVGMRFVRLPGGIAQLIEPGAGRSYNWFPADVNAYFLSTTEVTQRQFREIMGFNPSVSPGIGDDLPVQMVTWEQAVRFCQKLGEKENRRYRLPSEAEWEFALAGRMERDRTISELDHFAWYAGNSGRQLHPAGKLWANGFGLYDMIGNVAEWIADVPTRPGHSTIGSSFLSPAESCRPASSACIRGDGRQPYIGFRVALSVTP
jgi:serine/threonine protein kinase